MKSLQRIVDRAQIGVDLLAHVAGQEAQPLARLDGGPRQDQPLDGAAFEQRHRMADGEPGLAGAGRPLGEDEFVLLQRPQIEVLRGGAGLHGAALAGADLVEDEALVDGLLGEQRGLKRALLDGAVDVAGR